MTKLLKNNQQSLDKFINEQSNYGFTALHNGSQSGDLEMVQFLLNHNANINIRDHARGYTALHEAVEFNHLDIVRELIPYSDVSLRNSVLKIPSNDEIKQYIKNYDPDLIKEPEFN